MGGGERMDIWLKQIDTKMLDEKLQYIQINC